MIVDLGPLPYRMARDIVEWCVNNNSNMEKCARILEAMTVAPCPDDLDWILEIPDKQMTLFLLKWSSILHGC
jgi:hypothetical protein